MNGRKERLKKMMEVLGQTVQSISTTANIVPSNISKMLNGEQIITNKILQKIVEAFPQISSDWLKYGEGEILMQELTLEMKVRTDNEDTAMSDNLQQLLFEFVSIHESQGKLVDRAMGNTSRALEQTDKAIENTNRVMAELSEQRKQLDRIIAILMNSNLN